MSMIKFGTDGWRAIIADGFTFANLERVAQAAADYWSECPVSDRPYRIVIGYDRRFHADTFARRTAEVMAGNGFEVVLARSPVPTPSLSYAVRAERALGGVMITASHNPPIFGGFKLKGHFAGSIDSAMCRGIEARLDRTEVKKVAIHEAVTRKQVAFKRFEGNHFRAIRKLVDFDRIARSGLRFAHDALYGVGAGCFDRLLADTSCVVTTCHAEHDPLFGGMSPEPIEKNYGPTQAFLRKHPHDICLVTDGDADRIGGMDGEGGYLSANDLICLLLYHCVAHRRGKGRVVKALSTTSMVDRMCEQYGFALTETGVGFKHICAEMRKGDVFFGAEESGGVAFRGHIPERDGILAGLMLLELLATERKGVREILCDLQARYGPYCYRRADIRIPLETRPRLKEQLLKQAPGRLLDSPVIEVKDFDGIKLMARDGAWLMIRGSGTEPILRIYAESASGEKSDRLIRLGRRLVRTAQGRS